MKHILTSLCAMSLSIASFATTVNYTVDNTNFTNPERGFYEEVEQVVTNSTTSNLEDYYFTDAEAAGRSLLMRLYYLDNYRTSALPDNFLTLFDADMATFRAKGAKCILRFAYTNKGYDNKSKNEDASPTIWQQHLSQLKSHLQENADVIYVVQAGFMGAWGEWYYSNQGVGSAIPQSVKTNLINQLLDAIPASRFVQVRTPKYKTDYIGDATALTATTAWKQDARSRIGHHNDAFCNGAENEGTYENVTADKAYIAQECLYVPNGGETNIEEEHASNYTNYGTGVKALAEMRLLHFSYLGYDYSQYATDQWRTEKDASGTSYYDLMARYLGYRFELVQGTYPSEVGADRLLALKITLKNSGCAPLYNERHAYLVLKSSSKTYTVQLQSDPRTWVPDQTTTIQETVTLPSDIENGSYSLYLYLPDAGNAIASNPKFAVRCANTGVWDSSTGYNNLNATVQVTSSESVTPEPTPDPDPENPDGGDTTPSEQTGCKTDTIIRITITGKTTYTVSGSIGGTGAVYKLGSSSPYKLNKEGSYVMVQLADGNYFKEGDTLAVDMAFNQNKFYAYSDTAATATALIEESVTKSGTPVHTKFVLPAAANNTNQIWIFRTEANGQNGSLTGFEVYRKSCTGTTPEPDPTEPTTQTVTITFNDNQPSAWDDSFALTASGIGSVQVNKGSSYTIPSASPSIAEASEPDYLIYYFKGWNTAKDGSGVTYQANGTIASVTEDLTLYAKWEARPFDIIYYSDAAKTSQLNLAPASYIFDVPVTFPTPTQAGFDFVAWHFVEGGSVAPSSTEGYWGDFKLYPEWKATTPTALYESEETESVHKYIENGVVYIERAGITYTVLGTVVER